jgi:hypothetical protein
LLELNEVRDLVDPFDPQSLTYPWRHRDSEVDRLQADVMHIVASMRDAPRRDVFDAIDGSARERAQIAGRSSQALPARLSVAPHLTEAWYCCAEPASAEATAGGPGPDIGSYV